MYLSITLLQFFKKILDGHKAPTTAVICSTRNIFIQNLNTAVAQAQKNPNSADKEASQDFLNPPLMFLAGAQSVTLAFCPSLSSLFAYLSVYQAKARDTREGITVDPSDSSNCVPTLALLNPISLFNDDTSQFSAQSVGRFFALAYEAAARAKQDLFIAECHLSDLCNEDESDASHQKHTNDPERNEDVPMGELEDMDMAEQARGDDFSNGIRRRTDKLSNPWTQEIPISGSSNKKFGAAQRQLLERSISVRTVAERWCELCDVAT